MISPGGTSENSPAIYCRESFASAVIPAMNCRAILRRPYGTKKCPHFAPTFV